MSALLAHAKAYRVLAEEFELQSGVYSKSRTSDTWEILDGMACAYRQAAEKLEELARSETSPPYVSPIKAKAKP